MKFVHDHRAEGLFAGVQGGGSPPGRELFQSFTACFEFGEIDFGRFFDFFDFKDGARLLEPSSAVLLDSSE